MGIFDAYKSCAGFLTDRNTEIKKHVLFYAAKFVFILLHSNRYYNRLTVTLAICTPGDFCVQARSGIIALVYMWNL